MSHKWRPTSLGHHIDLLTGYPFSSELYSESTAGVRLLRGDNIGQGDLDWDDAKFWPISEVNGLHEYYLREGDLVLAMDRTWVKAGLKLAILTRDDMPCLLVQRVARMRGANGLETCFLRQLMESHRFAEYVKSVQTATAIPHISTRQLREYPFNLPSPFEQRAIVAVLSTWDRRIRQLSALIAAKVRFKQGLMQQLLTGKRRFKGFHDEWTSVQLRDVATECDERNRGRLGVERVMAVTKAEGIVPMRERTVGADIARYLVVQKNWFAYNPMRINIGSMARWGGHDNIMVSPDYVVFRCNDPNADRLGIDPDYLDHLRRSGIWENFVTAAGNGSVRVRIYFSDLGHLRVKLPSPPEQRKIADVLNASDKEIELLRKQLEALKLQKKGLMRKLLTGEVRVKPPSPSETEEPNP